MTNSIKDIKAQLDKITKPDDPFLTELASDARIGVQKALIRQKKIIAAAIAEEARLERLLTYERQLYQEGFKAIAGIDEVGRGPLAGPVVAACVVLPRNCKIKGLDDSKKIPKSKHDAIYQAVLEKAKGVGIGIIDHDTIDRVNIYEATKLAMIAATNHLKGEVSQPDYLLIDAMSLNLPIPQQSIIKGDANSLSIAAASIVAKVTRDRLMADYDKQFPGYDFAQNAGYGTKNHLCAIQNLGVSPIHRKSFEPIKSFISKD